MKPVKKFIASRYAPLVIILFLFLISSLFIFVFQQKNSNNSPNLADQSPLNRTIAALESAIESDGSSIKSYFDLSNAYLQKVRETGDSSYYDKIDSLMERAEAIDPQNAEIPATRSSVAMGRHHFRVAKKFAQDAIAKNRNRVAYYGLLGDANIELGEYDEAVDAFQSMVDMRPDFASYSRIAYIRELYGDIAGAKEALNLAITSGSNFKENIAWAYVELGKLNFRDNLADAEKNFNQALAVMPSYTQAYEGLGKVAFAKGNTEKAIEYFNKAFQALPLAQYSTDLADVYSALGDTVKRDQYLALTQEAYALSESSGVNTDLEESLFLSDHDMALDKALDEAKRAYIERPSIYAADCLGWAYYKNGNYVDAGKYAKDALRLGEFDPLILFHQGMIAYKNNNTVLAKKYLGEAYKLSPHFSILYSGTLKDTLAAIK